MADPLISSITNEITRIISSRVRQEVNLVVGVREEVQKLKNNFHAIQAVLEDAERRQTKEVAVRDWVNKLKHISYDMDDVLDDWSTAILKWEIEGADAKTARESKSRLRSFASCSPLNQLFVAFGFKQVIKRREVALKIREICQRLDEVVKEKSTYGFDVYRVVEEPERPVTTSRVDVSNVRGRDEDKKNLITALLGEVGSTEVEGEVVTVSIVGAGGIGKTTLAQLAYNDDEVKAHFEERIWICVSNPFNKLNLAKEIIQALDNTRADPIAHQLELLLNRISGLIMQKRFLLVLDDVWNENHAEWEPLKLSLRCGDPRSRILVTTRKDNVAKVMGTTHHIPIGLLSNKECWSLFRQLAFRGRSKEECEKFVDIGKEIAKKAEGLPLAAKVLGGLMQFKKSKEQWRNVLSNNLWEQEAVEKALFFPLLLSYYDLPAAIRRCFTYCSVFPKGCTMGKDELIKMWMAEGYLKAKASAEMELIGEEYFDNLVVRSFFQDLKANEYTGRVEFKMHDLVHDCAEFLSGRMESSFYKAARHARLLLPLRENIESISSAKSLRSLLIHVEEYSDIEVLPKLLGNLKYLRSLDLRSPCIEEIPNEVEELTHLRYLNLNGCPNLKVLPETLTNLCNLESLYLYGCVSLKRLPIRMQKLIRLRHLCVSSEMVCLPKGIGRLTSLRTLDYFKVHDEWYETEGAAKLGELEDLDQIEGKLHIWGLENDTDVGEAVKAQLKKKKRLTTLKLFFFGWEDELSNHYAILEALEPPPELEFLSIKAYRGALLPGWMISLTNLTELQLEAETSMDLLALARLPSLEKLTLGRVTIKSNNEDEGDMSMFVVQFPKLKQLQLQFMYGLEELDIAAEMPQLNSFKIYYCRKMKDLPGCILTAPLQKLSIFRCPILEEHYRKESGKSWHKISHVSHIHINDYDDIF